MIMMVVGALMYGVLLVTLFLVVRAILRISDAVERISRVLEQRSREETPVA